MEGINLVNLVVQVKVSSEVAFPFWGRSLLVCSIRQISLHYFVLLAWMSHLNLHRYAGWHGRAART